MCRKNDRGRRAAGRVEELGMANSVPLADKLSRWGPSRTVKAGRCCPDEVGRRSYGPRLSRKHKTTSFPSVSMLMNYRTSCQISQVCFAKVP
jgi:hypothetical protein